jgi:hypothetical protein
MATKIIAIPHDILKEAKVLRTSLQRGSLNILELDSFLAKVESHGFPLRRRKPRHDDLMHAALENLNRGHAKKPIINRL